SLRAPSPRLPGARPDCSTAWERATLGLPSPAKRAGGSVEKIWKKHWPPSVDEAAIRLPEETLPAIFARQARRVPGKPALIFYGREVTFAELDEAVSRFAGWLHARGIRAGDRVAIFLENSPQFAIAYYGALRAGGIAVCLNPMPKAD